MKRVLKSLVSSIFCVALTVSTLPAQNVNATYNNRYSSRGGASYQPVSSHDDRGRDRDQHDWDRDRHDGGDRDGVYGQPAYGPNYYANGYYAGGYYDYDHHAGRSAAVIGGSAAAGALIGAAAGHGQGAAIGAVIGGFAGIITDQAIRNHDHR